MSNRYSVIKKDGKKQTIVYSDVDLGSAIAFCSNRATKNAISKYHKGTSIPKWMKFYSKKKSGWQYKITVRKIDG